MATRQRFTVSASPDRARPGQTADGIMELAMAFWGSKTLLSAIELGVFSELALTGPLDVDDLRERLGLHPRSARDFFDALVALGMLARQDERYGNTAATAAFLDRAAPGYIGGVLEMVNSRLFGFWNCLTTGLRTGEPQNEASQEDDFFEVLYSDETRLREFVKAMTGLSAGAAGEIAAALPWDRYETVIDIGCAEGCVPVAIARAHGHLTGGGFDLPPVGPLFDEYVANADLSHRLTFHAGDFFAGPLPEADALVMGHILHNWDAHEKRVLLEKAFAALPEGGMLIVYDAIIDDERRANAFGLLMSLNMLIETAGGFDYTAADCQRWMRDVGFTDTSVQHLTGPTSMVVGYR